MKLWPPKYYKGLSRKKTQKRAKEISKFSKLHWTNPAAYKGFETNVGVKTRTSQYTRKLHHYFPGIKGLAAKSEATGVPLAALHKSYNRGMAAWRTGHRPGATQQQWGHARVDSLLVCGKTARTADADIVRDAKRHSLSAKRWFNKMCKR